ncbi:MAG: mechanosensitive ion channel [Planctomycetota bacterium]|nr:MAG: mechanosensitive ion channel [Planctomycetota bacterium]
MQVVREWLARVREILEVPIFKLGEAQITLWSALYLALLVVLLFYASGRLRRWLAERALTRTRLDAGARQAVASLTRYAVLLLGLLVILQTVGIDLTTLNVLAGAVGIGLGFGLQHVISNFVSGLIILFKRPIRVGDRIEVDEIEGDVVKIGARSTTVLTNDGIAVIVPNSKFITENVVNWKYSGDAVRFRVPVGVAYGSDLRLVERLLLEVAAQNVDVLEEPMPAVRFVAFGDSSLDLELRVWSSTLVHRKGQLVSALNYAIHDKFCAHGVEIPYPQRDLHIRSGTLERHGGQGEPQTGG